MKSRRLYELLLLTVMTVRATAFMFTKICVKTMGPFNLMAIRFCIAFIILAIIFHKKLFHANKNAVILGGTLGIGYFIMISTAAFALTDVMSQTVALVQNSAIVFVLVFMIIIYRKKPKMTDISCAFLVLAGVTFILMKGLSISLSGGMETGGADIFLYRLNSDSETVSVLLRAHIIK